MLVVIACSALKRKYRDLLVDHIQNYKPIHFVFLDLPGQQLKERLTRRSKTEGHFMPASLVDSQIEDLEKPEMDESPVDRTVTIVNGDLAEQTVDKIVGSVLKNISELMMKYKQN